MFLRIFLFYTHTTTRDLEVIYASTTKNVRRRSIFPLNAATTEFDRTPVGIRSIRLNPIFMKGKIGRRLPIADASTLDLQRQAGLFLSA